MSYKTKKTYILDWRKRKSNLEKGHSTHSTQIRERAGGKVHQSERRAMQRSWGRRGLGRAQNSPSSRKHTLVEEVGRVARDEAGGRQQGTHLPRRAREDHWGFYVAGDLVQVKSKITLVVVWRIKWPGWQGWKPKRPPLNPDHKRWDSKVGWRWWKAISFKMYSKFNLHLKCRQQVGWRVGVRKGDYYFFILAIWQMIKARNTLGGTIGIWWVKWQRMWREGSRTKP